MKTRYIYGIIAAAGLMLGTAACSDNLSGDLIPTERERTLNLTLGGNVLQDRTLNLGAAPSTTLVDVASNTRWTVEISRCEGGWCNVDVINGTGNGSFSISVLDNMKDKRECYVTVYKVDAEGNKDIDGSSEIKVVQAVSDVRLTPSSLSPFAPQQNERQLFEIVSNVDWKLYVTYENANATDFVTITPDTGTMNDNGEGVFSGDGGATFYMSLSNNRTAADRKAFINLQSDVATYSVEITQLKSQFTFDVSPAENQLVAAEGGTISFGVLSLSDWTVSTAADWITFSRSSGTSSEDRESTVATVAPNSSGYERKAEIYFKPSDSRYQELSLTVTQRGYDLTFAISNNGASDVVMEGGGNVSIDLDSRFKWHIVTPDWISANPISGEGSVNSQKITLEVAANTSNNNRTAAVTIYPDNTEFAGGAMLDPSKLGIETVHISVTQFGGREPAVSVPWIVDGYGQTYATIEFNYYSPFSDIVEAGLQWRKEDATAWNDTPAATGNGTEGTVSVELKELDPATKYVARGWVKDANGNVKYGSVSYPFTTAGQYPDSEDNETPEL